MTKLLTTIVWTLILFAGCNEQQVYKPIRGFVSPEVIQRRKENIVKFFDWASKNQLQFGYMMAELSIKAEEKKNGPRN